jgi:hypothetical protein
MPRALGPTFDVRPESFVGLYRFLEDGWRGRMLLAHEAGRVLVGRYRTDRYQGEFDVVAEVDELLPHKVNIRISNFNEMAEQLFEGYLLGAGGCAIAGVTYAEETVFGFCARMTRSLIFAQYRVGAVRPEDFVGTYGLHQGDEHGVLRLILDGERGFRGTYLSCNNGDRITEVSAEVDDTVRHGLHMSMDGVTLLGYLFTRPKNVLAGRVERDGVPRGFYMVKMSESAGPPV